MGKKILTYKYNYDLYTFLSLQMLLQIVSTWFYSARHMLLWSEFKPENEQYHQRNKNFMDKLKQELTSEKIVFHIFGIKISKNWKAKGCLYDDIILQRRVTCKEEISQKAYNTYSANEKNKILILITCKNELKRDQSYLFVQTYQQMISNKLELDFIEKFENEAVNFATEILDSIAKSTTFFDNIKLKYGNVKSQFVYFYIKMLFQ